jgi:hypothetical protein
MAENDKKKTGFSGLDDLLDGPGLDQAAIAAKPPKTHEKATDSVTSDSKSNQIKPTDSAQQQQKKSLDPKKDTGSKIVIAIWAFFIISIIVNNIMKSNEDKKTQYTSDSPITSEASVASADPPLVYESAAPAADVATEYLAEPPVASAPNWRLYDPNGNSWPQSTGYLENYPKLHTDGLSTLTIDNSQNSSDVHVKLYHLSGDSGQEVRNAFIKAGSSFTINKIRAGIYDVRYRDLAGGGLSKSESFELEEIPVGNSIQYSMMTMTLYKIANGNMQTQSISESQF